MRVFATRVFSRFARRSRIRDDVLADAIRRAEKGLVDADLGGGVIKQRVARPNEGRSGGFRTLIAYRSTTRAIFIFGFAKSDLDNVDDDELRQLRKAATEMLGWSDESAEAMVANGKWIEIDYDDEGL